MRKISPINRSKNQARQYYDRISKIYDFLTAGEKNLIQKGVELLGVNPREKIIEIGCGTGSGLKYLQKKLSAEGSLIGIDLSHQMLLESQKKIQSKPTEGFLVQGDAANLPMKSDIFDGLLCAFTLELFSLEEIPIVLNEFHRILKSDGKLVIISLGKEPHTIAVDIYEWFHKLFPVAIDCRPIPLFDVLITHGYEIESSETQQYWGLPINIALCKPV